jgi:putative flippase GtrA
MVGAMNTGVDWGLFFLFNMLFRVSTGEALVTHRALYLAANAIAVTAGILNSFIWNKRWTFSAGNSNRTRREAVVFVAVSVTSLGINTTGLWVLSHLITGTGMATVGVHKLGTSVVTMTWNFLGYRFLAFRPSANKRPAT